MLYFVDKNGKEKTWYVGNPVPKMESVIQVQADCDELGWSKIFTSCNKYNDVLLITS